MKLKFIGASIGIVILLLLAQSWYTNVTPLQAIQLAIAPGQFSPLKIPQGIPPARIGPGEIKPGEIGTGVVIENAALRIEPDPSSLIIDRIDAQVVVYITKPNVDGTWYQLRDGTWVSASVVQVISSTTNKLLPPGAPVSLDGSQPFLATGPVNAAIYWRNPIPGQVLFDARLRSGPSTLYTVIGGRFAFDTIVTIGSNQDGSWYQLEDRSWIAGFLVQLIPSPFRSIQNQSSALNSPLPTPTPISASPLASPIIGNDSTPAPAPPANQPAMPTETPTGYTYRDSYRYTYRDSYCH